MQPLQYVPFPFSNRLNYNHQLTKDHLALITRLFNTIHVNGDPVGSFDPA